MKFEKIIKKNKPIQRIILVLIGVFCMGFGLYWLDHIQFGTDSWTTFNLAISHKVGVDYGTTILVTNILLFISVLIWGRREIGIGTIANMVIVGYAKDFFEWLFSKIFIIPDSFFEPMLNRCIVLFPALAWFVFFAAIYMAVDLGTSPYDAVPNILSRKVFKNIPFMFVRIAYDALWAVIGFFLGGTVGAVTVLIALGLGPCITWVKKKLEKVFGFIND